MSKPKPSAPKLAPLTEAQHKQIELLVSSQGLDRDLAERAVRALGEGKHP